MINSNQKSGFALIKNVIERPKIKWKVIGKSKERKAYKREKAKQFFV
jgi:hypothetical protein